MKLEYIIEYKDIDKNINQIIQNEFNISSRLFSKLVRKHLIKLNDLQVDSRLTANLGDKITIDLNYDENNSNIVATKMNLNIIYEDEWLLIINKPAGIPIHPSQSHYESSLSNGIKYYFDCINLNKKIRPVNRLDLNTSGITIFAKNEYIQERLTKQMQNGTFIKEYIALIEGFLEKKEGIINEPIARKNGSIIERCVSKKGKSSITEYKILEEFPKDNYSSVLCKLHTGRTHQIRVHFSYIGHPLLGDTLYGTTSSLINRQALHSYKISFIHPIYKKVISLCCKLPDDIGLKVNINKISK